MSTAYKAYLYYVICKKKKKKSVNDAMIFYKTEIDVFAGEYVGRGTPKHRFIKAFLNNFFSSNTFKV